MTDYFALLDQPKRPWLNEEELKRIFHERALHTHPDAQRDRGAETETHFTELNEAYRVLRDPKRRLQHLLALTGTAAGQSGVVPPDLEELFPAVAALTQKADAVIQKATSATSTLSRSLVRSESFAAQQALDEMLRRLRDLRASATDELQQVDQRWQIDATSDLPSLQRLYLQFSYLERWIAELEEKQMRLSGTA